MELRGKTVFVTGAAKRIGREIALGVAQRGANVVIHYNTSRDDAQKTAKDCEKFGAKTLVVRADATKSREIRAAISKAIQKFGQIDVLVNSAAVYKKTPFATLTERDWDFHVDANLKGPFLFALEIGRHMKAKNVAGKIINFADWAAIRPYADYLPYCVSKAGVICLTKSLAKALAPNVQVNAIAPGPVLLPEGTGKKERQAIISATLVKRLGSPKDVVNAVIFLIEGGDFITGHTLVVDGGRLIAGV
jgi:NAD(P)-dependent dehydrogenase (short-subunit alcohol dehydrogenase family)